MVAQAYGLDRTGVIEQASNFLLFAGKQSPNCELRLTSEILDGYANG